MPNRIIKESICDSESIDKLSWFEEVLFYRLIVNCDDYGRFDGRTAVIKNRLFPLKDNLTIKQVDAAVNNLATYGLLTVYKYDGKRFVALQGWDRHQQIRAKRSKYPAPDDGEQESDIICNQMTSNAPVIQSNPNPNPNPKDAQARADVPTDPLESAILEFIAYRKKLRKPMTDKAIEMLRNKVPSLGKTDTERVAAIEQSIYRGWTDVYPFKGGPENLNQRGKSSVYRDSRSNDGETEKLMRELETGAII